MPNWVTGVDGVRLKVEVGFDSLPSVTVAATSWTDITVDVRAVTTRRGRSSNFDEYQPGTASVTLNNRDRDYDPVHATGPYFGKLLPMKRVRVSMSIGAGAFTPLYNGHILSFPQTYVRNTRDATVTINAVDGFYVLQRTILPSLYEYEVRQDDPYIWFRLGDGQAVDEGSARLNGVSGFLTASGVGPTHGIPFGSPGGLQFEGGDQIVVDTGPSFPAFPFTVEFWLEAEGSPVEEEEGGD